MRIIVNAIPLTNIGTGISRYISCLYQAMSRHNNKAKIIFFNGQTASPEMPNGPENVQQWSRLVAIFWKLPPRAALLVRVLMHARRQKAFSNLELNKFDIYHEAGFFPFNSPKNLKTIFTIHDMSVQRFPVHHPKERTLYYKRYFETGVDWSNHFLTVSAFSKNEIISFLKLPEDKITVTHLAHDPEIFTPQSDSYVHMVKAKYSLPEKYLFFAGSGDPRKNTRVIPKAIELTGLDMPLVCSGWSGWGDNSQNGRIISTGRVSDRELAALYSGASAFVFPSIYEGFGLPVLEAMACGCPVITTKEASLSEVGGQAAIYCSNPHSPQEWANTIKKTIVDNKLQAKVIDEGFANIKKFSWQKTAAQTWDVFNQVRYSRD